jgi:hypothetical protein
MNVITGGLYVSPFDEDLFQSPIEKSSNATALIGDDEGWLKQNALLSLQAIVDRLNDCGVGQQNACAS